MAPRAAPGRKRPRSVCACEAASAQRACNWPKLMAIIMAEGKPNWLGPVERLCLAAWVALRAVQMASVRPARRSPDSLARFAATIVAPTKRHTNTHEHTHTLACSLSSVIYGSPLGQATRRQVGKGAPSRPGARVCARHLAGTSPNGQLIYPPPE